MCRSHHKVIDKNAKRYTTDVLIALKQKHETAKKDIDPRLSKAQADEFEFKLRKWCEDNEAKLELQVETRFTVYDDRAHIGTVVVNSGLTPAFIKDYRLSVEGKEFKQQIAGYPFGVTYKVGRENPQKIPIAHLDDILQSAGLGGDQWQFKAIVEKPDGIDWQGGAYQSYVHLPLTAWVEFETLFGEKKTLERRVFARVRQRFAGDETQPLV